MSNLCNFQVFCEVYLQEEPTAELFRDFFHLNRRTEFVNGPNTELGGVSIQKREEVEFPHAKLHSDPKDWNQTWFYCRDTLLKMRILCRVTVLTGLLILIHFHNA